MGEAANTRCGYLSSLTKRCPLWLFPFLFFSLFFLIVFLTPAVILYGIELRPPNIEVIGSDFTITFSEEIPGELDCEYVSTVHLTNHNPYPLTLDVEYTELAEPGNNNVISRDNGAKLILPKEDVLVYEATFIIKDLLQDDYTKRILNASTKGGLVYVDSYSKLKTNIKMYGFIPISKS